MAVYTWIDPDTLPQLTKEEPNHVVVELSPYDIPRWMIASYSPGQQALTLRFEYIDNEPPLRSSPQTGIHIAIGRHSGKLQEITAPLISAEKRDVACAREAILKCIELIEAPKGAHNREAVGQLVATMFPEIVESVSRTPADCE